MLDIYTANTPNGVKMTIAMEAFEKVAGKDYRLHILNLSKKEQKRPEFLAVNPNGRIPAITDHDGGTSLDVFESGAILLYLAEKFGQLLPRDPALRIEAIAWTYFQTGGIGPNMGQAGYYKNNFPDGPDYARFLAESERLAGVMDVAT